MVYRPQPEFEAPDFPATFGIVDLFAGPGGLGEGFASLDVGGHAPFRIGISVEKEASAHRTLTLRAFLRAHQARDGMLPQAFIDFHAGLIPEPDWSEVDAAAWQHATAEAQCLELGTAPAAAAIVDDCRVPANAVFQQSDLAGRLLLRSG